MAPSENEAEHILGGQLFHQNNHHQTVEKINGDNVVIVSNNQ